MKKCFLASACAFALPSLAELDQAKLEHVLVSMPVHKTEAKTALPVTVLSKEDIARRASATIGDTLNLLPGLSSASFGPAVGQPVIRGQQGPRVSVLQNSLPALDVSTNSADHAVSVEPILARNIEVLRGPSTLLYGGGAIGGVVNVIDNRVPGTHLDGVDAAMELRHNSVDDAQTGVFVVDAGSGPWQWHIDGTYREWNAPEIPGLAVNAENINDDETVEESSDGFIANADGRTSRYSIGSAYHFDRGYAGISFTALKNNYGIPAGVHEHHHEEVVDGEVHDDEAHEEEGGIRLDVEQQRWDLAGDYHLDGIWELLRWRASYSEYEHRELEPEGGVGTVFDRDAWALRTELAHREIGKLHGVVGMQYQQSSFSAIGEEAFVPATDHRALGLFLVEDYHSDRWQLEAGLRLDLDHLDAPDSQIGDHRYEGVSASLAGMYDLDANWTASLSYSQSRRAATAEERYANALNDTQTYVVHGATGAIEVGDDTLNRERSDNIEIGLRATFDRVQGSLNLYRNQFSDFIFLQNTGVEIDEAPVLVYAQDDAAFSGLEYTLEFALLSSTASSQLTLRLFGDRVRGKLDGGAHVPRLPPRRDGVAIHWSKADRYAELSWVNAGKQNRPGLNEPSTSGYDRIDASFGWTLGDQVARYTLLLNLRNITDEEIRNSSSFIRDVAPEPGRAIEFGLRLNFES